MGKRTGRPRGAPPGNTNRLKHGRYSARRIRRRKETNVLLRSVRNLTRRIEMMAWSRKALRMKRAGEAKVPSLTSPLWGGRNAGAQRKHFGWGSERADKARPPPVSLRSPTSPQGGGQKIRGSPRSGVAMTKRPDPAMPFAGKFLMAFA